MIKINKFLGYLIVSIFCVSLTGGSLLSAATPARQLAKGISLFNDEKNEEAMNYFLDVLVNGNRDEVAEATKYVHLIHDRIGGVQDPVIVDVNFKEGEIKSLDAVTDPAVLAAQEKARAAAEGTLAKANSAKEDAEALTLAKKNEILTTALAEQKVITDSIEAQRAAAMQEGKDLNEAELGVAAVDATLGKDGLTATADADKAALMTQASEEVAAASAFADLTTPEAAEARAIYTKQKIESMTAASIEKINGVKGVYLYMREGRPDALDIDPQVLFTSKNTFKTSAQPLLNSIYELLALTQGSAYVILPAGSYTDDVTLSGIRQAMALNSYLINRGLSQGKLHYNMGLSDQEPPARYANLSGISIVFDYDAKLPANMEKNENNDKAPLLSMAVVPLCHSLDRSLGEAFVIDFSVLETASPIENWVLHIVQHGRDGKYYIVRQLEGFTSVYHQIVWNGRKGIIGPELPCGKYTLVLTATDLKGEKQTLRRRIVVKCSKQKKSSCRTGACTATRELCPKCDYKTPRLWTKPGRTMGGATYDEPAADASAETVTTTTTVTTVVEEAPATADQSMAQNGYPYQDQNLSTEPMPMDNPYDMPYDDYQN